MHEVSLAQNIVSMAAAEAEKADRKVVKAVTVRVGAWTCVNPELLLRAFEAAASEGKAAGAELRIEVVAPVCFCESCGSRFDPEAFSLVCTRCGGRNVRLQQGRELEIVSVEV